MKKSVFIALEHIAALNEFRKHSIQSGNLLLSEDLKNAFKACGIPSNPLFISEFRKSGLLIRVNNCKWSWKNKLPIHHQTLQNIYNRYKYRAVMYVNVHRAKKKEEEMRRAKRIEEAIEFLKSCGFEIMAPCKELYRKV